MKEYYAAIELVLSNSGRSAVEAVELGREDLSPAADLIGYLAGVSEKSPGRTVLLNLFRKMLGRPETDAVRWLELREKYYARFADPDEAPAGRALLAAAALEGDDFERAREYVDRMLKEELVLETLAERMSDPEYADSYAAAKAAYEQTREWSREKKYEPSV